MGDSLARRSTWGKGPRGSSWYTEYISALWTLSFISLLASCPLPQVPTPVLVLAKG